MAFENIVFQFLFLCKIMSFGLLSRRGQQRGSFPRRAKLLTTIGEGKKMVGISTELLTNPKQADGQGIL
jgi:hypothetical protein